MPCQLPAKTARMFGALLVLGAILHACTTTKDGFSYRVYHNTTAHFNGHFNAGESLKKGEAKLRLGHSENYDEILPLFIRGTEETAKEAFPEMERAIEKCEKVISRHTITNDSKKGKKRPKLNKWIDENYMIIGQAYYYKRNYFKAEELFQFVSRKYKEEETQVISTTWLARSYIARGENSKATQALNRVSPTEEMDNQVKADYYLVWADNYIQLGKYNEAAEKLETALKYIDKKRNRARPHFILAQLYQRINKSTEALREYDAVIRSRAPYELEFYARINKALSFSRRGGSSDEIRKELMKLLRDEKNISYRDQIYYALGEIELEEQNRQAAIDYFQQSIEASEGNNRQKAKTFLRLADLYFDQRQYVSAQVNYDSTFRKITEVHPRYKEIKARAESLTELVGYLDIIQLNDSLLRVCEMGEADREKMIRRAQKKIEEEMAKKRQEDEERAAQATRNNAESGGTGTFWAYNQEQREKGKSDFDDRWGERPLKDNWRLQSRLSLDTGSPDESIVTAATSEGGTAEPADRYYVPTLDELRASLPCDDNQKVETAKAEVAEAYYMSGVIYKEKLDDEDNAINAWEELIRNMETSDFHPVAHYLLFRTWLSKEQLSNYKKNPFCETCDSKYWGDQIKALYPGSDWAILVDNPEYLDIKDVKETEEREAYEAAYSLYSSRNYPAAIKACTKVIDGEPDNHLLCKYKLLRAVCVGYTEASYGLKEKYLAELQAVVTTCPGTQEAERCAELITAAREEGAGTTGQQPKEDESNGQQTPPDPVPAAEIYTFNENMEHYFVLVLPTAGTNVNTIKANVSDYNTEYYASSGLKVTNNLLDKDTHMLLVKPFKTIPEARDYENGFRSNTNRLGAINAGGYTTFLISKSNYIQLFKTKNLEAYLQFFEKNY
ncbi:MAG: tetratricopeptide repeat protein [Flavobacteriales bacterium]|jgi:tetratricopeptide (TPR) repeat protein